MKKNMKVGKIVSFAFYALAIIAMSAIILAIITGNRGKNGITIGPYSLFTVLTGSMSPTFDAGSIIVTKKVDADKLQAGDILTYSPHGDNTLVTHRIVEVINDGDGYSYKTRGDANNVDDVQPVPYENSIGRVTFWMNGVGYLLLYVRTPMGIAYIVIVVMLLVFISSVLGRNGLGKQKTDLSEKTADISRLNNT